MRHKPWIALLAALALTLSLLAGCGGQDNTPAPDPVPAAGDTEKQDPPASNPAPRQPEGDGQPEGEIPAENTPEEPKEGGAEAPDAEAQPEKPAQKSQLEPAPQQTPVPAPEPEPEPEPAPEPAPEGESIMAGDTYTISVTLEGGSGRATVESPATLHYRNGTCWATIVWSSPNFDYMKVDGQRYDPINTEGNSTFEIPVSTFDQPLAVIADTIAMSEPHEVEYTLTFDYASMEDA